MNRIAIGNLDSIDLLYLQEKCADSTKYLADIFI